MKLSLKTLQEFVRLQTYNRSGFQQIQLDMQFLRTPLKEIADDEAAIDFLLDEVTWKTLLDILHLEFLFLFSVNFPDLHLITIFSHF